MKLPSLLRYVAPAVFPRRTRCRPGAARTRGYALIVVLTVAALAVVIMASFLSRSTTELVSSESYRNSVAARQWSDTAVGMVQGMISHATTRGSDVAWTSQPGMVRTFDTSGNLVKAYKLYSAPDMVSADVSLTADLPPADWATRRALWSDLNGPVEANGRKHFPILVAPGEPESALSTIAGDPSGAAIPAGFSVTPAPGGTTYQSAPMPVRWLYALRDGTLVAPTEQPNVKGGVDAKVQGASESNPIVGRVAFWTDDETCKVNVNTASEGSFWDIPHGYNQTEYDGFSPRQPGRREYQRYPGHPATVSLSAIFPGLAAEDIYGIIPRVMGEGDNPNGVGWTSKGGTQVPKFVTNGNDTAQGIRSDGQRLFASVDELMWKPDRTPNGVVSKEVAGSPALLPHGAESCSGDKSL